LWLKDDIWGVAQGGVRGGLMEGCLDGVGIVFLWTVIVARKGMDEFGNASERLERVWLEGDS
jgi:hypothetical protein